MNYSFITLPQAQKSRLGSARREFRSGQQYRHPWRLGQSALPFFEAPWLMPVATQETFPFEHVITMLAEELDRIHRSGGKRGAAF